LQILSKKLSVEEQSVMVEFLKADRLEGDDDASTDDEGSSSTTPTNAQTAPPPSCAAMLRACDIRGKGDDWTRVDIEDHFFWMVLPKGKAGMKAGSNVKDAFVLGARAMPNFNKSLASYIVYKPPSSSSAPAGAAGVSVRDSGMHAVAEATKAAAQIRAESAAAASMSARGQQIAAYNDIVVEVGNYDFDNSWAAQEEFPSVLDAPPPEDVDESRVGGVSGYIRSLVVAINTPVGQTPDPVSTKISDNAHVDLVMQLFDRPAEADPSCSRVRTLCLLRRMLTRPIKSGTPVFIRIVIS
jgi:hypothetical protein